MSVKALPRRIFLKQVASASGALAVGAAATEPRGRRFHRGAGADAKQRAEIIDYLKTVK